MTSELTSLLDNPYVIFIGWTLALALWQTTVIGLLFAGWLSWRSDAAPSRRYVAAGLSLIAAVVLALSTPVQLARMQSRSSTSAPASVSAPRSPTRAAPAPSIEDVSSTEIDRQLPARSVSGADIAAAAAMLWILVFAFLACRIVGGLWLAHSIAVAASRVADPAITGAAGKLRTELGLSREVPVLESTSVEAPVVIGWRVPRLILPHDAAERLSPEMITALLEHEFAHIRRGDYIANLIQSWIEAVLCFSPLVVWMSRRIRETREFCCDDAAVSRSGDPKGYVQALTTLASLGALNTTRPALGATGPRLITRVRRLLQGEAMPRFQYARIIGFAMMSVVVAVMGMRVSAASAARAPRLSAGVANPSPLVQDKVPFGFATEQEGSGVELQRIVSTAEEPAQLAVVKNLSNEPVVGLRFVASVERWGRTLSGRRPVRLFVSPVVVVSIPPGGTVQVSPNVLTAAQLQTIASESGDVRLQLFFGLQSVSFANGYGWSITPNSAALSGSDALNIPRPVYSRDLIARDAGRPAVPYGACRDDRNRTTSHGGMFSILNEPGHMMVCDNGRWIEAPPSGR
jgi:beta-lactamase regulating signal transducer with metallopeptidase domain